MSMRLSSNFSLDELCFSQTAAREGIVNRPNETQIRQLRALCQALLQPIRDDLASPLVITSGFRSPRLNKAVGGAPSSQHMNGQAADIVCSSMSSKALFKHVLGLGLPFDQLIFEGGRQSAWVHVSYVKEDPRGQIYRGSFPEGGGVLYTPLSREDAMCL